MQKTLNDLSSAEKKAFLNKAGDALDDIANVAFSLMDTVKDISGAIDKKVDSQRESKTEIFSENAEA